jgi:hypothetical protein
LSFIGFEIFKPNDYNTLSVLKKKHLAKFTFSIDNNPDFNNHPPQQLPPFVSTPLSMESLPTTPDVLLAVIGLVIHKEKYVSFQMTFRTQDAFGTLCFRLLYFGTPSITNYFL